MQVHPTVKEGFIMMRTKGERHDFNMTLTFLFRHMRSWLQSFLFSSPAAPCIVSTQWMRILRLRLLRVRPAWLRQDDCVSQ